MKDGAENVGAHVPVIENALEPGDVGHAGVARRVSMATWHERDSGARARVHIAVTTTPRRAREWRLITRRVLATLSPLMLRKAFRMSVHRGRETEYERRHTPIWPELESTLRAHGVRHYSIFLDPETNDLFGYVEIDSEERWQAIASTAVCQRWWASMRELMPSNPDNSPVSSELREVFHIGHIGPDVDGGGAARA